MLLGLVVLIVGILIRKGQWRAYYWFIPFSYYRNVAYGSIPLGIAISIIGIGPLFYDTPWIVFLRILVIGLGLLGIFMWIFQPKFAKPDWINWLEANHYDVLPELRQEVLRIGIKDWNRKIKNRTDLEAWIKEVRRKRGL
jgi:hypothetical protein